MSGHYLINTNFIHPTSMCTGEEAYWINTSVGVASQTWFENGTPVRTNVHHLFTPTSVGNDTIRLRIFNGSCQHIKQLIISVHEAPTIDNFNVSDSILCFGSPLNLTSSSTGDTTSARYENSCFISNLDSTTCSPVASVTFECTYFVSNTNCSDSMSARVTVNPLPTVDLGLDTNDCFGPVVLDLPTNGRIDRLIKHSLLLYLEFIRLLLPTGMDAQTMMKCPLNRVQTVSGEMNIDFGALTSGIYFVQLITEYSNALLKVIKE